jgi:small subunit ribosomal protein S16
MVRIRLRRIGLKNQPTYRVVVADKESPRDGRFLEIVGFYNPRTNPITLEIKEDKIYEWMAKGAQPTESVLKLFNSIGVMERFIRFKAGEAVEKLLIDAKAAPRNVITKKAKPAKEVVAPKTEKPAEEAKTPEAAAEKPVEAKAPEATAEKPAKAKAPEATAEKPAKAKAPEAAA